LAVCAATVISDVASIYARGVSALVAAVVIGAVQLPDCARVISNSLWNAKQASELIGVLRRLPGKTLLAPQPSFALLASKQLPRQYYATDPLVATMLGQYNQTVANSLPEVDYIVMNSWVMNELDRKNLATIVRLNKPIYFETAADLIEWEARLSRPAPPPRSLPRPRDP
jgi:hypothetical protein